MLKVKLFLIIVFFTGNNAIAQLAAGDIMFVGYNADGDDGFAIVTFVDIPANSTIYFTDNEWNGDPIGSGGKFKSTSEGELTWSTGGSIISAGTVIIFDETNDETNTNYGSSIGTISGTLDLNASNEVLYAFLGTDDETPTSFLSAIANDGFSNGTGVLTNTGLTAGVNAISLTGDDDVLVYDGDSTCNVSIAACADSVANPANWSTEDGVGDQSANSSYPDFPSSLIKAFEGTVLPIELTLFEAYVVDHYKVELVWITASEVNNDFFTIERSENAMHWYNVMEIEGAGSSFMEIKYSTFDNQPYEGRNYYRLKQTDFDGQYSYSDVISVLLPENRYQNVDLFPNPARDVVTLRGNQEELNQFGIYDWSGKNVGDRIILTSGNEHNLYIDVGGLAPGVYFVKTKTQCVKLSKVH